MKDESYVVYDLEIVKGIQGRGEERVPGIDYCDGWNDHAGMGISVLCCLEMPAGRMRVFCEDNIDEARECLESAGLLVGFNNVRFDDRVIEAAWGITAPNMPRYDILREAWKAKELDPDSFNFRTHGGFSLDGFASSCFGLGKTGHGARAPIDWQQGRIGSVIDYCSADVWLTNMVFQRICDVGSLISPKGDKKAIRMAPPFRRTHKTTSEAGL